MRNDNLRFGICICIIFILFISYYSSYNNENVINIQSETKIEKDTVYLDTDTVYCFVNTSENIDWDAFIKSIIYVESRGNCYAIGKHDDVGVLQIRQTIVDDCNRIVGYDKYSLEDRTDSLLSIEMFNVIQNYYNPHKDPHYALKIWNPRSSFNYHFKIAKQYDKIVG